ncbi:MAG: sensor histidine kinase [Candidatus Nanoarchaeia archaeon]
MVTKKEGDMVDGLCREFLLNTNSALCIADSRSKIIFANKRFGSLFGECNSLKSICRSGLKELCSASNKSNETEIEWKFQNLLVMHTPLKSGNKTYFVKAFRDVTKLRQVEAHLEEYTKNLEKEIDLKTEELRREIRLSEEKRAALINMMDDLNVAYKALEDDVIKKDELFDITSHELKTPLVPIEGFTDLLLNEKGLNKTQKEYLLSIKKNVDRLQDLLENIIDISRLQARKAVFDLSSTDISEILKDVIDEQSPVARKKCIKISRRLSPTRIICDPRLMKRVFKHLLDNALKFSNKGNITIRLKREKKNVLLSVADEGVGIPAKARNKVFDKFFQVDSSADRIVGGAGLGLSICKAVVEAHKGEIWVESSPEGSTFFVRLPVKLKSSAREDVYGSNVAILEKERKKLEERRLDLMTEP